MKVAPPPEFPHVVCWQPSVRAEVMNTIALDVDPAIFKATHFPSFVQQEGAARGTFEAVTEHGFLDDFLDVNHPHVFNIAVGDSGTGKSHLIRWMYQEARRRDPTSERYRTILIPRSSSNLADVVRGILKGFDGEVARKLREELGQHHGLSLDEARQRVIDELAYVVEERAAEPLLLIPGRQLAPEEQDVLQLLPAVLRRQEFRRALIANETGVVTRLAQHVLGKRSGSEAEEAELRWLASDLLFPHQALKGGADEALEAADMLRNDARLRELAAEAFNRAKAEAIRKLLRFRSGDMKAALAEIRQELLGQGKDLVLFIEDLSVTEGLDAELTEALQVRKRDTSVELARLRSIVGVTHDDFARLRENIAEGRTHRIVYFNVSAVAVGAEVVADFASRYLNAARANLQDLREWAEDDENPVPNLCDDCPNRGVCHEAFGSVDGRGLYPLSPIAVMRLYDHVASSRKTGDHAFNPRLLVSRVLNHVLEEGERSIPQKAFPRSTLTTSFKLNDVRAEIQLELRQRFGSDAERLENAVDIYSTSPSAARPHFPEGISTAFGLPFPDPSLFSAIAEVPQPAAPTDQPTLNRVDDFERWGHGEAISDSVVNIWRQSVYDAVRAWIDWDVKRLAALRSKFKRAQIGFEGQFTKLKGDVTLFISRSPENVLALRALSERPGLTPAERERGLRYVRRQVSIWSEDVERQLRGFSEEAGAPLQNAAEFLLLGALIRGRVSTRTAEEALLAETLRDWPEEADADRSAAWRAIWKAYEKHGDSVRELVIDALSCSKGGVVGAMIDPTSILDTLRSSLSRAKPDALPAESDNWRHHAAVAKLAKEVAEHLEQAIDDETAACSEWITSTRALIGETDLATVVTAVTGAIDAAANVGVDAPGLSKLRERLGALGSRSTAGQKRDISRAIESEERAARISALGKLERGLMTEIHDVLADADESVRHLTLGVQERLAQFGEDSDPDQLERDCGELLGRVRSHLTELVRGTDA